MTSLIAKTQTLTLHLLLQDQDLGEMAIGCDLAEKQQQTQHLDGMLPKKVEEGKQRRNGK
ncbi:hypothetical protein Syun_019848 [Stephania yunnanensis]|uniref:Uncharacterized protein n=1 Tax=Stephania yunnanensis TaxID=152371 RepID=A0AAP0NZT3_9MAGN